MYTPSSWEHAQPLYEKALFLLSFGLSLAWKGTLRKHIYLLVYAYCKMYWNLVDVNCLKCILLTLWIHQIFPISWVYIEEGKSSMIQTVILRINGTFSLAHHSVIFVQNGELQIRDFLHLYRKPIILYSSSHRGMSIAVFVLIRKLYLHWFCLHLVQYLNILNL